MKISHLLLLATTLGSAVMAADSMGDPKNMVTLANPGFETKIDFTQAAASDAWKRIDFSNGQAASVTWLENGGVDDSACVKIEIPAASGKGSVGIIQNLTGLAPDTMYRYRAMLKTQNVTQGRGALLYDMSARQAWNVSQLTHGDNDWMPVYMDFYSSQKGEAQIVCSLGFRRSGTVNGGYSDGVAFFDNVSVEKMTPENYCYVSSEYITLVAPKDEVTEQEALSYAKQLDGVYLGIAKLLGGAMPSAGSKLVIMPTQGMEKGYWALAGNPILKNESMSDIIKHGAATGDLAFGVVHEMGHVFNADINFPDKSYAYAWNWNDEIFANFRAFYGVKIANALIHFHGVDYVGGELGNFYKKQYEGSLGAKERKQWMGDDITYILIRLGNEFGWDVMEKTFQDMYLNDSGPLPTVWDKFNFIVETFAKHAQKDVKASFPEGELEFLEKNMQD